MTTIVAVRRNGQTCVVADSLVTYGNRRKESYGHLLVPSAKLLLCNGAIVGFPGSVAWDQCLKEFFRLLGHDIGTCNLNAVQKLFSNFWQSFKEGVEIAQIPDERFTSFSSCQIIVARHDCIFEITAEGCVIENKNVVVVGNGVPFSHGAIRALEPFTQDPFELAMAGVRAAAAWDPNTSGPFLGWSISKTGEFAEFSCPT
jgi:ATP-dependent protease HslVU (ClpYQ) peptidase subunit